MTTPDIVTSPEAGQILGCSAKTVVRLVRRGTLKPARRLDTGPNGAFLFFRADVEQLAKAKLLGKPTMNVPLDEDDSVAQPA